jgi:subtilase family serine protease
MRLPAAYFAACLAVASCAPPNDATTAATSNDTLTFPVGPSYTPTPPIDDTTETITFTVQNNSTDSTAVNNIPYVINRDSVAYSSGSIATIAPGATQTIIFTVTESDGLSHTYEVVLDPNDTTGAVNTTSNTQSVTIDWQPSSSG